MTFNGNTDRGEKSAGKGANETRTELTIFVCDVKAVMYTLARRSAFALNFRITNGTSFRGRSIRIVVPNGVAVQRGTITNTINTRVVLTKVIL